METPKEFDAERLSAQLSDIQARLNRVEERLGLSAPVQPTQPAEHADQQSVEPVTAAPTLAVEEHRPDATVSPESATTPPVVASEQHSDPAIEASAPVVPPPVPAQPEWPQTPAQETRPTRGPSL